MVFPLGDDNTGRTSFPIVNVSLIVVNVLVFVFLQGLGSNERFTFSYSTVPAEIIAGKDLVSPDQVVLMDTIVGPQEVRMPGLQRTPIPVYLTLLTSMFMHGGIVHLLGNMWFLWIFGDNIEHDLGRFGYLVFYLACGILAGLAHVFVSTEAPASLVPCLGASGAISGVMGAYLVLHPYRRVVVLLFQFVTAVPGIVAVGIWFIFQVVSGMGILGGDQAGVAYGAHVGGFVAGAAIAVPLKGRLNRRE
jgi:membrane associated rhomboid family serine protease